jgi:hypothetical protein
VLALALGVLYAFEPAKGDLLWTRRVGIDTQILPLRVPADALTPELALVLSSDQRSLSAVIVATGATLWQTPLSGACIGRPVLVDRTILTPTLAGQIDEIEIAEGRFMGSYHVGQVLALGGVHQPGTSLVYFPADEFCLYVIDITKRLCTNVVYTRHAAGSLRGLPPIANDGKTDWLLWTQAKGVGGSELQPLALPLTGTALPTSEPALPLPVLSAAPWLDSYRLAAMTQRGALSLFGVRQKGTSDPLLFRLVPSDFSVDLAKTPGRCEVVHADAETIWTISRGRLQRVDYQFQPMKGPELMTRWTQPIRLGKPLHDVQTRQEADGRTVLYVTTQAEDHATCLFSAVSGDDGKLLWQRQLGAVPVAAPRAFGSHVLLPCAEGILRFEPEAEKTPKPWRQGGTWVVKEVKPNAARFLLAKGAQVVQLVWKADDVDLRVEIGADKVLNVKLRAPLHGTPALGDGFLLFPLANGILVHMNLAGELKDGPDWRAIGADDFARGHVVMLSDGDFLLTDGARTIQRLTSVDFKTKATRQMAFRIVRPPVVLPAADKAGPRVCVLDASDTLTLLDADRLTPLRSWQMPGKVTAGPFVRAGKIGCVVGRKQLVWLDPNQDKAAWEYGFDADVIGEPHLIDGVLVVGDVAGQFIALDPGSGRPLGAKLTLKANVAPTAAPLPFGEGRAFVPLTDGTIMILPLAKLR